MVCSPHGLMAQPLPPGSAPYSHLWQGGGGGRWAWVSRVGWVQPDLGVSLGVGDAQPEDTALRLAVLGSDSVSLLSDCVILSISHNLSEPLFLHL